MTRWLLGIALATSLTACGITSRHTLGPTIDSQGHVGVRFAGSLGPLVGPRRAIGVPVRLAAGVTSVDRKPLVEGEAALTFEATVGADWNIEAKDAAGLSPARLGKRIGLRLGRLRVGAKDAWLMGASGALTVPLRGNLFSLGVEGGCDVLADAEDPDAGRFRCDLGLLFDIGRSRVIDEPAPGP